MVKVRTATAAVWNPNAHRRQIALHLHCAGVGRVPPRAACPLHPPSASSRMCPVDPPPTIRYPSVASLSASMVGDRSRRAEAVHVLAPGVVGERAIERRVRRAGAWCSGPGTSPGCRPQAAPDSRRLLFGRSFVFPPCGRRFGGNGSCSRCEDFPVDKLVEKLIGSPVVEDREGTQVFAADGEHLAVVVTT